MWRVGKMPDFVGQAARKRVRQRGQLVSVRRKAWPRRNPPFAAAGLNEDSLALLLGFQGGADLGRHHRFDRRKKLLLFGFGRLPIGHNAHDRGA